MDTGSIDKLIETTLGSEVLSPDTKDSFILRFEEEYTGKYADMHTRSYGDKQVPASWKKQGVLFEKTEEMYECVLLNYIADKKPDSIAFRFCSDSNLSSFTFIKNGGLYLLQKNNTSKTEIFLSNPKDYQIP